MLPAVLTLVADEAYLPHAKSVLVNAARQGEWKGDYCLILPPEVDSSYFTSRGIYVLTDDQPRHYRKFALFDQYFNQEYITQWGTPDYKWETVLYLDCDVVIQNPLAQLTHECGWGTILADREMFTVRHAFTNWADAEDLAKPEAVKLLDEIFQRFGPYDRQYNTGVMVFHPRTIPVDAREILTKTREKYELINTHVVNGTDQSLINVAFYEMFERVHSDLICYFRSAWEKTIVVHTCSGYAPWIKKTPGQNAYANEKLGRVCHELYRECLRDFETVFPVIT